VDKRVPQLLLGKSQPSSWGSPTSSFFFGDLEILQKREAYIVAECCTHFPPLLVWESNKKLKLGMKMGKELKTIQNRYAHILRVEFLLKTDSRYPKDTGVNLFTLATPGNPLSL